MASKHLTFLLVTVFLSIGTLLAANSARTMRTLLLILLMAFLMAIVIGLFEIGRDFPLPISGLIGRLARVQRASTYFFHNQDDLATYIALSLPFCWRQVSSPGGYRSCRRHSYAARYPMSARVHRLLCQSRCLCSDRC